MFSRYIITLTLLLSLGSPLSKALAQVPRTTSPLDTTHKFQNPTGVSADTRKPFYRSKLFRASVVPAVLIGYGISTINDHGFYSSYDAHRDITRAFGPGPHTRVDDFLQFVPYFELGGVLLAGVESHNDRVNLGLVILKSEAIMLASVYTVKMLTRIDRPNGEATAFPSGHTAQAFLAASIVHTELRDKSQWYGIGAYTVATSVAALRMVNEKHWQSDVLAGAGFGILSAHLAYLSHRNRWGRKPLGRDVGMAPIWSPSGGTGVSVSWRPR